MHLCTYNNRLVTHHFGEILKEIWISENPVCMLCSLCFHGDWLGGDPMCVCMCVTAQLNALMLFLQSASGEGRTSG